MRIVIVNTRVPFVDGGAEVLAKGLRNALERAGHHVELIAIPFKWYPPERIVEQILAEGKPERAPERKATGT